MGGGIQAAHRDARPEVCGGHLSPSTTHEVEEQRRAGHRPPLTAIISTWWAHDTATDQRWRRESRSWDTATASIYSMWAKWWTWVHCLRQVRGRTAPTVRFASVFGAEEVLVKPGNHMVCGSK